MTGNKGNEKKITLDEEQASGGGKKSAQGDIARGNDGGMIFDDVMRTIQERREELLIPVVNDAFGEHYSKDTEVKRLPESFQKMVSKVVADGCSVIGNHIYHLEVQSSNDSTMAIRMVEYDFMIGLSAAEKGEKGYRIRLPKSCIIYIRHNQNTPKEERVTVEFPVAKAKTKTMTYRVPVLKVQEYTLDELFEKELYAYLPFYLMRHEKNLEQIERDEEQTRELLAECEVLLNRLEKALADEPATFQDLLRLIRKVTDHLLRKREKLKGEVETVMGGKVLDLPSDKLREEREAGRIAGIVEGKAEGKAEDILDLLEDLGPVPKKLREKICTISNIEVLRKLLKLAAKADSMEEFEKMARGTME